MSLKYITDINANIKMTNPAFSFSSDGGIISDKIRCNDPPLIDTDVVRKIDIVPLSPFSHFTTPITTTDITESTDINTGALIIDGGVGIEKNINIGGNLGINGIIDIENTTESTDINTGALIIDGGVGISKNLNIGGDLNIEGNINSVGELNITDVNSTNLITSSLNLKFPCQELIVTGISNSPRGKIHYDYYDSNYAYQNTGSGGSIIKIDLSNKSFITYISGLDAFQNDLCEGENNIFYACSTTGKFYKLDMNSGTSSVITTSLPAISSPFIILLLMFIS